MFFIILPDFSATFFFHPVFSHPVFKFVNILFWPCKQFFSIYLIPSYQKNSGPSITQTIWIHFSNI